MKTKRRHFVFVALTMILFVITETSAQTYVKTFTFRFPESSFTLEQNEEDCIVPDAAQYNWAYGEDPSKPKLPYISYYILLPDDYNIKDFTFSTDDIWFAEGVTLMPNPTVTPTSTAETEMEEQSPYPLVKYSAEAICVSEDLTDGYRIANFNINPFTYHADNGKLALATSLKLTITIEPVEGEKIGHTGSMTNLVKSLVINPEDLGKGLEGWTPVSVNIIEADSDSRSSLMRIAISNSTIHCTAPDTTKLEVYTMDAVKVGEARFVGGKASVKVANTSTVYLYIVTYPDGRRESGKIALQQQ